ncbi:MAG: glycosyltransferase family 2 protein [Methylobacteriaceae bacterium]|nr:glycosyltransferase family 2 protein [Methylobacteriaceae bacterium]
MSETLSQFETPVGVPARAIEAVVCVPTFRRPEMLARTLSSLVGQQTRVSFAVVVVDNDNAAPQGAAVAEAILGKENLIGRSVVEPQQGNVHAINRAFSTALALYESAQFFLMIDDDEVAGPGWLDAMIKAARDNVCDIVGGPVLPVFESTGEARRCHPVFLPAYASSGLVKMIYGSGNCLITRAAFERLGTYFDPRFNFLGGGDTEFFTRAKAAGLRFFWSQDAVVREVVGPERVKSAWLVKRGLRIGAINYTIDRLRARTHAQRLNVLIKNAGVFGFAAYRSVRLLFAGAPLLETLHPTVVALGRWLAAFGIYPEQYRAKAGALS